MDNLNPSAIFWAGALFAMWTDVFQAICVGRTAVERVSNAVAVTAVCGVFLALFIFVALKLIDAFNAA